MFNTGLLLQDCSEPKNFDQSETPANNCSMQCVMNCLDRCNIVIETDGIQQVIHHNSPTDSHQFLTPLLPTVGANHDTIPSLHS